MFCQERHRIAGFGAGFVVLTVLLILIQVVFGNIIEPKFTGRRLELSPLVVLLSLFFWGAVWGIGGMLFSVPLTLTIKILLRQNRSTEDLAKYIV